MALGGILATALTDRAVRLKLLTVGGVDVIHQPGNTTNPYGVSLGSIEVIEAGPDGGASSMTFTIDDPAIAVTVSAGMEVRFHNVATDVPIFLGRVQSRTYVPDFGQQGRRIEVRAIGSDAILDWAVTLIALSFTGNPSPTPLETCFQSVVANCSATGELRTGSNSAISSQTQPTGAGFAGFTLSTVGVDIPAGTTLREAFRQIWAAALIWTDNTWLGATTVDFYFGLRTYIRAQAGRIPSDWTLLTITDTPAGTAQIEDLSYTLNASEIVRNVYVIGGNALGTGLVSDGSGVIGQTAVLSDTTILTTNARDTAAKSYLAQYAESVRGIMSRRAHVPVSTVHAGGVASITDARASLAGATPYVLGSITKRFHGSVEDWTIEFGGRGPSAVMALRRLTRSTLS